MVLLCEFFQYNFKSKALLKKNHMDTNLVKECLKVTKNCNSIRTYMIFSITRRSLQANLKQRPKHSN